MRPSLSVKIPPGTQVAWRPSDGPQTEALLCDADELLYGGAAGGGKTDFLLVAALAGVKQSSYKAVIFRRTYPELESSVIDRARFLIPTIRDLGAVENTSKHEWIFASRSRLLFRHLEDDAAVLAHRSAEYQYLAFDELTTFTERQYRYLLTRARSSRGIRPLIRAATNPGGPGHEWVKARWAPWLDPESKLKAVSGEVLYYLTHPETGADIWVPPGTPGALSRCFIAARLEDNPYLDEGYRSKLAAQDPLTRRQLAEGDWNATPAPKTFFNRAWAPIVDRAPQDLRVVRAWDRAATEAAPGKDPDWTVGVKLGYSEIEETYYVLDVIRLRAGPGGVKAKIVEAAIADSVQCEVALALDPGAAGVFEGNEYLSTLRGFVASLHRETGDKVTRAKAVSALFAPSPGSQLGRFRLLKGDWNLSFLAELEEFPTKGIHDDQVDSLSLAFRVLCEGGGGAAALTRTDYARAGISLPQAESALQSRSAPQARKPANGGMRFRRR